jgi:TolA-binding protein
VLVSTVVIALAAAPARAADRETRQIMADVRILQQQAQELQTLIGALTEAIKGLDGRINAQAELNRKSFADQKLLIDTATNDLRVVRERVDDNNVRVGSLSQEVEALRQSVIQLSLVRTAPPPPVPEPDPSNPAATSAPTDAAVAAPPAASPAPTVAVGTSPQRLLEAAFADYSAGHWDLAIEGYDSYVKSFPKSDQADDAQVQICNAYLNAGKDIEAIEACDVAIRTYPSGNAILEAYYRKGTALRNLKQTDRAREAFDYIIKTAPGSNMAVLAQQRATELQKP